MTTILELTRKIMRIVDPGIEELRRQTSEELADKVRNAIIPDFHEPGVFKGCCFVECEWEFKIQGLEPGSEEMSGAMIELEIRDHVRTTHANLVCMLHSAVHELDE